MKKEKRSGGAAGALIALLLLFAALTGFIFLLAGSAPGMASRMRAAAPEETTGLPDAEYDGMARMIAGYLTGREEVFQYVFTDREGTGRVCFQDREQRHMADCRGLVLLSGRLALILAAAGAAGVLLSALWARRDTDRQERLVEGALFGMGLAAILTGALTVWGAIDFESFFLAFHRLAFPGGGYYLNPRTDLLIRLMPERFFIGYGITGVLFWTGLLASAMLAAGLIRKQRRRKP